MNTREDAPRNDEIERGHHGGATYAELSERFGISRQRCHQIVASRTDRRKRDGDALYASVSDAADRIGAHRCARAYNAIVRDGIDDSWTWDDIMLRYGIGIVTAAVIATALGIEIPSGDRERLAAMGYPKTSVEESVDTNL